MGVREFVNRVTGREESCCQRWKRTIIISTVSVLVVTITIGVVLLVKNGNTNNKNSGGDSNYNTSSNNEETPYPKHWISARKFFNEHDINLVELSKSSDEKALTSLQKVIAICDPEKGIKSFGGKDDHSTKANKTKGLIFLKAWRNENWRKWKEYQTNRQMIESDFKNNLRLSSEIEMRTLPISEDFRFLQEEGALPGPRVKWSRNTGENINEVFLLHGTNEEAAFHILSKGFNEKYVTTAAFGKGNYFAEHPAKISQYAGKDPDENFDINKQSHKHLYKEEKNFPVWEKKDLGTGKGGLFSKASSDVDGVEYMLVNRVLMGHYEPLNHLDGRRQEWRQLATDPELPKIPKSNPEISYHSRFKGQDAGVGHFHEFIQMHGVRVFPEYIVAYRREYKE